MASNPFTSDNQSPPQSGEESGPGIALAAVLHSGEQAGDRLLTAIARGLVGRGVRVGGVIQSNPIRAGQCRCDMVLEELTGGAIIPISQNLGPHARGCRLDPVALEHVVGLVEASLDKPLDILILNKFGKQEAEGKGLRNAIALALEAGIPVLVGLNRANTAAWSEFSAGAGRMLQPDEAEIAVWLAESLATMRVTTGAARLAPAAPG